MMYFSTTPANNDYFPDMTTFFTYLATTFGLLLFVAVLISFCKRRQSKTRHGLTGMCHQSGGAMCGSCSARLRSSSEKKNGPDDGWLGR